MEYRYEGTFSTAMLKRLNAVNVRGTINAMTCSP